MGSINIFKPLPTSEPSINLSNNRSISKNFSEIFWECRESNPEQRSVNTTSVLCRPQSISEVSACLWVTSFFSQDENRKSTQADLNIERDVDEDPVGVGLDLVRAEEHVGLEVVQRLVYHVHLCKDIKWLDVVEDWVSNPLGAIKDLTSKGWEIQSARGLISWTRDVVISHFWNNNA